MKNQLANNDLNKEADDSSSHLSPLAVCQPAQSPRPIRARVRALQRLMRTSKGQYREGLEDDYECTSLGGPLCAGLGPDGGEDAPGEFVSDPLEDGTVVIEIEGGGNLDLTHILQMFKGGMFDASLAKFPGGGSFHVSSFTLFYLIKMPLKSTPLSACRMSCS